MQEIGVNDKMRALIWGTGKNAKRIVQMGISAAIVGIIETKKKMRHYGDCLCLMQTTFR